jgi:hypothetical protein
MLGEWGIVAVIYHEVETTRLDRFLEVAFSDKHSQARQDIYDAFCGLTPAAGTPRGTAFRDLLASDLTLRRKCDRELALLERIGMSLPLLPPYRRKALRYLPHTIVFMWEILGPYIQQRRESSIPHWAGYYVRFASASLREIEREGRRKLVVLDPNRTRKQDIELTTQRLLEIRQELEQARRV